VGLFQRWTGESSPAVSYDDLLAAAAEELRAKTEAHCHAWRLHEAHDWSLNQDDGRLVILFADGIVARAEAQIIGTLDTTAKTWMWAWNNPSIDRTLCRAAERVQAFGKQHHLEQLTAPTWQATENEAWGMTALACKLCDAQGAYRGPAGTTHIFMTFGEVQVRKVRQADDFLAE
jgi:hypothetical protein